MDDLKEDCGSDSASLTGQALQVAVLDSRSTEGREGLEEDTGSESAGPTGQALQVTDLDSRSTEGRDDLEKDTRSESAGPSGEIFDDVGSQHSYTEEDDLEIDIHSQCSSFYQLSNSTTSDLDTISDECEEQILTMEVIEVIWECKGPLFAIHYALCIHDVDVMASIFQILWDTPATWTMEICSVIMPSLLTLFNHNDLEYFSLALRTLKFLVSSFNKIIIHNLNPPGLHSGNLIDFGRIRRYSQSVSTYKYIQKIKVVLKNRREEYFNTPMFRVIEEVLSCTAILETSSQC